jgi:hypothetical protein
MQLFYNRKFCFAGLTILILAVFFLFRPLNAPHYRIIVADGLGYYAYLPAKFIYNDTALKFEWFDEVFNKHYNDHLFENPSQNFMVEYGNRMINLYYPGLSLLQAPFFFAAHAFAKVSGFPDDGFSLPYQIAMGLCAIFYTILGLYYCSKLIYNLSKRQGLSLLIPILVFLGTNLFTYSIFNGCYTHAFSFCFIALAYYQMERFFSQPYNKLHHLSLTLLFSLIVISLRPFNIILLAGALYFFKPIHLKTFLLNKKPLSSLIVPILALIVVAIYNGNILYTMTGTFLANTYTIGKFYFWHWKHFADNIYGFQSGILWYTPLIPLSFCALFYAGKKPRILFLMLPVITVILLYSFWFYWNIVYRTLVELSPIICLLLMILFESIRQRSILSRSVIVLAIIFTAVFQLKAYQLREGILDGNYTWSKYYFKDFFRVRHKDVYPVDPAVVINNQTYFFNYESSTDRAVSTANPFDGKRAALLSSTFEFASTESFNIPFTGVKGVKKVKASFWCYRGKNINNIHLVFAFTKNDSLLNYQAFYIHQNTSPERWDHKEFGMDYPTGLDSTSVLNVYFWNPEKKDEAYIDNLKIEFLLSNGANEIPVFE